MADFQRIKKAVEIEKEQEEKEQKEDKLHQFLMELDESTFRAVKSSFLSQDPLLYLDEAYQVVLQNEESKCGSRMIEE